MTSRLLVDKIEGKTTSGSIQMPQGHVIQTVGSLAVVKLYPASLTLVNATSYS